MLNPQQVGILAQLVHDALVKFPNPPAQETVERWGTDVPESFMEPWEVYLKTECGKIPELPAYETLDIEVEMLVEYFDSNIRFQEGQVVCRSHT